MSASMFYDRDGRPMEMLAWAQKMEDGEYRLVAQHWVRGWMVSTLWFGINLGLGFGARPPLIFETMTFPPGDEAGRCGDYQERYSTEAAASAGHDRALSWLQEKLGGDITADIAGPLIPGSSDSDWDGDLSAEIWPTQ